MNVGQLLEISGFYWKTCTLHAGVKLDLFTHLGEEEITGEELARRLDADPRAVRMLADALTAMGLLNKSGDLYGNTSFSRTHLDRNQPEYMGYIILHHQHLMDSWSRLDQAVREGKPTRRRVSHDESVENRKNFLLGMFNLALNLAPQIVKAVNLTGRSRFLDLGGGPGTYAICFCKEYEGLKATVFDLPSTRPFAEETIARFQMSHRVDFVDGNFLERELPQGFDVVWLSHILHAEGPHECRTIVQRAAEALEPGGLMLIHEFLLEDSLASPLFPALFSLNMLLGTDKGQSYSESQVKEMMAEAGLHSIRRLPFTGPSSSSIVQGVKPSPAKGA